MKLTKVKILKQIGIDRAKEDKLVALIPVPASYKPTKENPQAGLSASQRVVLGMCFESDLFEKGWTVKEDGKYITIPTECWGLYNVAENGDVSIPDNPDAGEVAGLLAELTDPANGVDMFELVKAVNNGLDLSERKRIHPKSRAQTSVATKAVNTATNIVQQFIGAAMAKQDMLALAAMQKAPDPIAYATEYLKTGKTELLS